MRSEAFKRRLAFSFTIIILQLYLLRLKSFITKALEYKAVLKFQDNLYALLHLYAFLSDESLFTELPFDIIVYWLLQYVV